jgi:hypothetical protein
MAQHVNHQLSGLEARGTMQGYDMIDRQQHNIYDYTICRPSHTAMQGRAVCQGTGISK